MEFPLENLNGLLLPLAALTVISGLVGLVIGMLWRRSKAGEMEEKAQKRAQRLFKEMEVQRRAEMLEEKRKWHDAREAQEEEINRRQSALVSQEQDMMDREKECEQRYDNLKDREDQTGLREDELEKTEERLNAQEVRLKESASEYRNRLESLARLTSEEAKQKLHGELIRDVKQEAEHQVRDIMKTAQTNANREARKIVTLAISRCAVDQSTQTSVAVVPLPNDQIKARIIGKDGRNIRTFEAASEVKVMVDDTPEAVVISCFDPIRREIARTAMADLVSNGKITQSRIEEIIGRAQEQIDSRLLSEGQQAVNELKLKSMHPEMMKLVGRLRFRSSYGQNALDHSKEVAFLTGMMAVEIGLDELLARRCGLLHDVGKALDHEMEGSHPEIGLAFAEKYGEPEEVKNAIIAHHNDENEEITSPITFLVAAADAISGARPGARRNDPEDYVRRVVELEELARAFDGVADAYAINAGREIRVMVRPDQVDDDRTHTLASEISQKIRNDLTYPGHIKVTVIREKIAHRMTNKRDDQQHGGRRRSYGRNRNRRHAPASSGQAAG
ncbi:MAG: ribonuclease Y [Gemmatimonadetes bacterium]|nr:ribonuclease Y [Gemmatimonadota bacterium]MYH20025.1 ribonuclease Y [Gemmatimonadota bacterium]MYK99853.1 ribonuclease Y [Gemmatimonadota bacterium]